jgi:hypothetical protein
MNKILLSITAIMAAGASFAQDTLSNHYANASFTYYSVDGTVPLDSGYVSGNNAYGDLAKLQKFDASVGVSGGGQIKGVCLWVANKVGTGAFQVLILKDAAGAPDLTLGGVLGTSTVMLSAVDTSSAGLQGIVNGGPVPVGFNAVAMFASPIGIPGTPGNYKFWVSLVLPTGANQMSLVQNNVQTFPYADAATHVGELLSTSAYSAITGWGASFLATFAMFPIMQFSPASLDEASFVTGVYPNPASSELNITSNEALASVSVVAMDGKVVATSTTSTVNVAALAAGTYTYQAVTVSGKVAHGKFNKN